MDIEDKHWKGIKETTGLTKEEFEKNVTMEEEIKEFMDDLDEWVKASKRIQLKYNFDPQLFLLWRLTKK